MPFVSYIKSDTGFLRKLIQNTGFSYANAFEQGPPVPGNVSPSSDINEDQLRLLEAPPGSLMSPFSVAEYNALTDGQKKTLFGFNLYDSNKAYTHHIYRFHMIGGEYTNSFQIDVYDETTQTVINSQALTYTLPKTVEYFTIMCHLGAYNNRQVLGVWLIYKLSGFDTYDASNARACIYLDAGEGSIIPTGEGTELVVVTDPNEDDPGGNSGEGGGGGDHDPSSDIVDDEDLTDLNNIKGGLVTYYKITDSQLETLADELFSSSIWDAIKNFFEKPQDIIAGMLLLPVTPASGTAYYPKYGINRLDNLPLYEVAARFKDVQCGSLYVAEYYGSAFDYSPYSRVSIFLPFIGIRELDVDEVMGKWLSVKYRIDCYTGNCLATIYIGTGVAGSNTVRYQFSGNCGQQLPISSVDFSNVINGAISFATVAVASLVTAGAAGGAAGTAAVNSGASIAETEMIAQSAQAAANTKAAQDIAGAAVNTVMNAKPIVTRSGSVGESIGMMGVLKPYIIRTIPRQSLPTNYKHFYGYPANIAGTVGSFTGYTVFDSVILQNIPGTDTEIAEIDRALKGGVYV